MNQIHELPEDKYVIIDLFSALFQDLIDAMGNQPSVAPENHIIEAISWSEILVL